MTTSPPNVLIGINTTTGNPQITLSQSNDTILLDGKVTGISNALNFSSHLMPTLTSSYDIGSSNVTVRNVYTKNILANTATITGNLVVNGTATTVNTTTLTVQDNIVTLNNGLTTEPLSTMRSGIEVNRGAASNNYFFLFEESTQLFKIGKSNATADSLQSVATREQDIPDRTIAVWDSNNSKYTYSSNVVVDANGNMGVGVSAPNYRIHANGDIYASGDLLAFSDARYKTNVKPIENALAIVEAMSGYYYNRVGEEKRNIGFMAQELAQTLPEVVSYHSESDQYSVNYPVVTALLVEAIKELSKRLSVAN